ncbi:hypothetical protein CANMA_002332 [Candida margitis]|uniref:uncharacterized protein n=1 Tax=Candida margitis TaxID=1775924 RepID=UPI002226635C|nr:uncharacterized protein CANMA_002332 [Candida margitis]KAI5968587.1 hypothetical protein CANMA_002332 [Candida margitis]
MELMTIEKFLPYLEPYANKELLTPAEALQLSLLITELLVDDYVDFGLLKFLSRFLTQQSYDEIIEERNIEHECGYVFNGTTPASRTDAGASTKYQIYNRKPSIILPNTYKSQYCCKDHYQASVFYRNQLSNEAVFARKDIMVVPPFQGGSRYWYENSITCLEEVIAKHKELKEEGKSMAEVVAMMNGLNVNGDEMNEDTNQLIKLIEDFDIVEKEVDYHHPTDGKIPEQAVESDEEEEGDSSLAHNRIEGYITTNKSFGGYVV